MEGIEISEGRVGARHDIVLLTVKGYVDTMTCSILLNKITEILNSGTYHIIVDMAHVNYVSSAGWGVFVGEIKGIREKGGDLKIVQMTPEVYDVFEMLEFHRILSYYDSIEEAIDDFDVSIGLDITKSLQRHFEYGEELEVDVPTPTLTKAPVAADTSQVKTQFVFQKPKVDEKLLPLNEKIKLVVIEDPNRGPLQIKKALNSAKYGYTKVSLIKIYSLLKKLNLETKEQRYRFYRSR